MAKYKVGDKVRVRKDLVKGNRYKMKSNDYSDRVVQEMYEKAGKVVTIKRVSSSEYGYIIEEDDWNWTDDMFEGLASKSTTTEIKLESNMKFEIKSYKVINNKVVIVEFADGDVQKSVCMDGDVFDEERGLEVCIMKHICGGKAKYHKVLKEANKQIIALEEAEKKAKAEEELLAKKKAKDDANKAQRKANRRAERVSEMTEAFSAALKENGGNVSDVSEGVLSKIINAFKN